MVVDVALARTTRRRIVSPDSCFDNIECCCGEDLCRQQAGIFVSVSGAAIADCPIEKWGTSNTGRKVWFVTEKVQNALNFQKAKGLTREKAIKKKKEEERTVKCSPCVVMKVETPDISEKLQEIVKEIQEEATVESLVVEKCVSTEKENPIDDAVVTAEAELVEKTAETVEISGDKTPSTKPYEIVDRVKPSPRRLLKQENLILKNIRSKGLGSFVRKADGKPAFFKRAVKVEDDVVGSQPDAASHTAMLGEVEETKGDETEKPKKKRVRRKKRSPHRARQERRKVLRLLCKIFSRPEPEKKVEETPKKVGGRGDCWKKLWRSLIPSQTDENGIQWATLEQVMQWPKSPEYRAYKRQVNNNPRMNMLVVWSRQEDGDLHIESCRAGNNPEDGEISWIELVELWSKEPLTKSVAMEDSAISLDERVDVLVGSAARLIAESTRINGPEFAKLAGMEIFNNDYASLPKTKYRMTDSELQEASRYIGTPLISTQRARNTNDHILLAVARDRIREALEGYFPHSADVATVLHMGSTMREVKEWLSHAGHDFEFHLGESKDSARMVSSVRDFVGARLAAMKLPALRTEKATPFRVSFDAIPDALSLLEVGGRKRFHFGENDPRKHDTIIAEDCLYDVTFKEFADKWVANDAKSGFATMFFPERLFDPTAVKSSIYNYEEVYELQESVEDIINQVWPTILLITPLLPLGPLAEQVHNALRYALTTGWDVFVDWLNRAKTDQYPIELLSGVSFDLLKIGPIWRQIFSTFKEWFREKFLKVRITYKKGASSGYLHYKSSWEKWIKHRRMPLPNGKFVSWEFVEQSGEMHLLKFYEDLGESPIVASVALPEHRATAMVADIESAWDPVAKRLKTELTYFPILRSDVLTVLNWALGEPVDSLTPAIVQTMLNRTRAGLSIATQLIVEPMSIDPAEVSKVALAVLMEVYRRQNVLSTITESKELRDDFRTNLSVYLETLAKTAVTIATGGLAIPLYYLFAWLTESNPTYKWLDFGTDDIKVVQEKAQRSKLTNEERKAKLNRPLTMVFKGEANKGADKSSACYVCNARNKGLFSADGNVENGQLFACTNHTEENDHEIGFQAEAMVDVHSKVRDIKNDHIKMMAKNVADLMRNLEHFLEANIGGLEYQVKIRNIRGGPGTGKSVVIRELTSELEKSGNNVAITFPFKKLGRDYINAELFDHTKHTFNADTLFYTPRHNNMHYLIVDEATGVDWSVLRAIAIYIGAKEILIVGDKDQTRLRPEANEGTDPTNIGSGLDWSKVPDHDLIYNYRLDAWRVKLLNKKFGYKMIAKRTDELPPKFITKAEYDEIKRVMPVEKEMVFAHGSATTVFGTDSQPGNEDTNLSVRSCQGSTFKTSACSASMLDAETAKAHGMLNVSVSRSRGQHYYVTPTSLDDPVVSWIREQLWCDSPERIAAIAHQPWPDLPKTEKPAEMTYLEKKANKWMMDRRDAIASIDQEHNEADPDEFVQKVEVGKKILLMDNTAEKFKPKRFDLEEFYQSVFQTCIFDCLMGLGMDEKVRAARFDFMEYVYSRDDLMGHKPCVPNVLKKGKKRYRPLPTYKGKVLLPLYAAWDYINKKVMPIAVTKDLINIALKPKVPQSGVTPEVIHVTENHAERTKAIKKVTIKWDDILQPEEVHPLSVFLGSYAVDYKEDPASRVRTIFRPRVEEMKVLNTELRARKAKDSKEMKDVNDKRLNEDKKTATVFGFRMVQAFAREKKRQSEPVIVEEEQEMELDPGIEVIDPDEEFVEVIPDEDSVSIVSEGETLSVYDESEVIDIIDEAFAHDEEMVDVVGVKLDNYHHPTLSRVEPTNLPRWALREATAFSDFSSSWKEVERTEPEPKLSKSPIRLGTDGYRLHPFVDPSGAWTRSSAINEAGPTLGPKSDKSIKMQWPGFFFGRTKAGFLKHRQQKAYLSINPGLANHFNDSPEETLIAADRLGKTKPKPHLCGETKEYAHKLAKNMFEQHWRPTFRMNSEQANYRLQEALKALRIRNYHGRAEADEKKMTFGRPTLVVSNKDQQKPIKDGKLNLLKGGQAILQSPPLINLRWIGWHRIMGAHMKHACQDHMFLDDYENVTNFRTRLTRKMRELPEAARIGIMDFEEFDSQQNEVTLEIEKEFRRLTGGHSRAIEEYYKIRGNVNYIMHGLFSGTTNGEKGSGFLDTKSGNTILSVALASEVFEGVGEKVVAGKGDDHLRVQTGLVINDAKKSIVQKMTGMTFKVEVGEGGEFCGHSVSRAGMFPSITRTAMKTSCKPARDYKHFCEQQKSLREAIADWRNCGLHETVHYSAIAENNTPGYVETCLAFVNSMAHINETQWRTVTKTRTANRYFLPTAKGPCLV